MLHHLTLHLSLVAGDLGTTTPSHRGTSTGATQAPGNKSLQTELSPILLPTDQGLGAPPGRPRLSPRAASSPLQLQVLRPRYNTTLRYLRKGYQFVNIGQSLELYLFFGKLHIELKPGEAVQHADGLAVIGILFSVSPRFVFTAHKYMYQHFWQGLVFNSLPLPS